MFGTHVRVLLCPQCGAPIESAVVGGQARCTYCNAVGVLAGRDDSPLFQAHAQAPVAEPERIARLRTQDGRPLLPPPALQGLLDGGSLAQWKVQEALAIW